LFNGRKDLDEDGANNCEEEEEGFGRQRGKFVLLSASHSTRVSTPTTSISGPGAKSINVA